MGTSGKTVMQECLCLWCGKAVRGGPARNAYSGDFFYRAGSDTRAEPTIIGYTHLDCPRVEIVRGLENVR